MIIKPNKSRISLQNACGFVRLASLNKAAFRGKDHKAGPRFRLLRDTAPPPDVGRLYHPEVPK